MHSVEGGGGKLFQLVGALPQRLAAALPAAILVAGALRCAPYDPTLQTYASRPPLLHLFVALSAFNYLLSTPVPT